jgi:hypothetical protein
MMDNHLEDLANRIAFGGEYRVIRDTLYILGDITNDDRLFIDYITKQARREAESNDLLGELELYAILEEQGVWGRENDKRIDGLKLSIGELHSKLDEGLSPSDRTKAKKLLNVMDKELEKLTDQRALLFSTCDKNYVDGKRIAAMAFRGLLDENRNRVWDKWTEFQAATAEFIHEVTKAITFPDIQMKDYRAIARSGFWRSRWNAAGKNTFYLFGRNAGSLTQYQEMLVYWSQIYDSVYDAYERPGEDIINDDEKLDKWLKDQASKDKNERATNGKSSLPISNKVGKHGEIGIVVNPQINPEAPDINRVTELNSESAKKFLAYQEKKIKESVMIREEKLRESKDARRIIGSRDAIVAKKKRPDGFTGRTVQQYLPGGTL